MKTLSNTAVVHLLCTLPLLLGSGPALAEPRLAALQTFRARPEGALELRQFRLTRQVSRRAAGQPVVLLERDHQRLYAYVELLNKGQQRKVTMTWKQQGREVARHELDVGRSPGWRTWSYLTAGQHAGGHWSVAVHDEQGRLLGEQFFFVR